MKVLLTKRRSADARCAYCHDSLDGVLSSCPRCLTAFHKDCRAHLAQCPTLGCGTVFTHGPEVEVEREPPASLASELIRERLGIVLLGVASAALLAGLAATTAWSKDVTVIAGFLLLGVLASAGALARDLGFFLALRGVLRRAPVRMTMEILSELRGDSDQGLRRVFTARLAGSSGELLSLDLGSALPAWLLAPGPQVLVHFAERGPVAIRSLAGHSYAVPERRVTRHV